MRKMLPFLAGAAVLALSACGGSKAPDEAATASDSMAAESAATPAATEAADAAAAPTGDAMADAAAATAGAAAAAPAAFAQCKVCHSTEKGKNMVGPSLAGIYGTKAGDVAGYTFSKAMLDSGKVWDDATLDAYLTAPMKVVPGTKMAFAGISDPAKRKEVIDYLKTLK